MPGKKIWVGLAAGAAAWFVIDGILMPPAFGGTDIYYFKEAGINLAEGLGLTTRFSYGNPTFEYQDYAHYPPLYPVLFGLFSRLSGISAEANQAFNSLMALLVGCLGFAALRPVATAAAGPRLRATLDTALATACLVTGFYQLSYDRPDALASAFGMVALIASIRGGTAWSALAGGACCVLAACTSPFAGIWAGLGIGIGTFAATPSWQLPWRRWLTIALGAGITATAAWLALRLALPGWFTGFAGVATGANTHNETGGGYFLALLRGDWRTWLSGFAYSGAESYVPLVKAGATAAALLTAILLGGARQAGRVHAWKLTPLLAASALPLLIAPYQSNYLMIMATLLLTTWATIETRRQAAPTPLAAFAILSAFALNALVSVPFEVRELAVRLASAESRQRALDYLQTHRPELENRDGFTAVSPTNYILWRQVGLHPLIEIYSGFRDPENRARLATLALSFPGSGNLLRPQPAALIPEDEYRLVYRPALPQPATLLGFRISNSSQTWESAIYGRRE